MSRPGGLIYALFLWFFTMFAVTVHKLVFGSVSLQKPMQSTVETLENASILSESSSQEGHRLWIGNIDPKITE